MVSAKIIAGVILAGVLGYFLFNNLSFLKPKSETQNTPVSPQSATIASSEPVQNLPASEPNPEPTIASSPIIDTSKRTVNLGQEVKLSVGESVGLKGTGIFVRVVSATLSDAKIASASLEVTRDKQTETLQYYINNGSDANEDVLMRMRSKEAFGYTFIAVNVNTNSFVLRIEKS